ncbi:hypothetical protein [Streptomyces sp. NPDC007883]|uniref:hypothetical protein n=1 Tax=Streptomyces sp. NPDC007883 TaxID=3155116 RepID=UPI0033D73E4D
MSKPTCVELSTSPEHEQGVDGRRPVLVVTGSETMGECRMKSLTCGAAVLRRLGQQRRAAPLLAGGTARAPEAARRPASRGPPAAP